MRITAKCTIKHHPHYLSEGDTVTVDDAAGAVMVANGWAVNADTGESVAPSAAPASLTVDKAQHTTKNSEI